MLLASLKDLYLDELGSLFAAETQMLRILPAFIDAARAPDLRDFLTDHCEESRLHLERLQLVFTHWGHRPPSGANATVTGIVREADERLNRDMTDDVRDAAIVGLVQRIEHYEIAVYGCARTYASRLGREDEARLLQETLDEEGRADRRLTEMAEAHINDDARAETDFAPPSAAVEFRFVDRRQLDYSRLTLDTLRVCNQENEDLGTFDGLLMTTDSSTPRYIVVGTRGLFSVRRYLLPVAEVQFDGRARVLRVDLSKEVAERYPEFDRDRFEAMDEQGVREYESRLFEFFPGHGVADAGRRRHSPPEWLMTGVWITVPPDRAEHLSDEARTFANEFSPMAGTSADSAARPLRTSVDERTFASARGREGFERVEEERIVALEDPLSDTDETTPPHGDKLR